MSFIQPDSQYPSELRLQLLKPYNEKPYEFT